MNVQNTIQYLARFSSYVKLPISSRSFSVSGLYCFECSTWLP